MSTPSVFDFFITYCMCKSKWTKFQKYAKLLRSEKFIIVINEPLNYIGVYKAKEHKIV